MLKDILGHFFISSSFHQEVHEIFWHHYVK